MKRIKPSVFVLLFVLFLCVASFFSVVSLLSLSRAFDAPAHAAGGGDPYDPNEGYYPNPTKQSQLAPGLLNQSLPSGYKPLHMRDDEWFKNWAIDNVQLDGSNRKDSFVISLPDLNASDPGNSFSEFLDSFKLSIGDSLEYNYCTRIFAYEDVPNVPNASQGDPIDVFMNQEPKKRHLAACDARFFEFERENGEPIQNNFTPKMDSEKCGDDAALSNIVIKSITLEGTTWLGEPVGAIKYEMSDVENIVAGSYYVRGVELAFDFELKESIIEKEEYWFYWNFDSSGRPAQSDDDYNARQDQGYYRPEVYKSEERNCNIGGLNFESYVSGYDENVNFSDSDVKINFTSRVDVKTEIDGLLDGAMRQARYDGETEWKDRVGLYETESDSSCEIEGSASWDGKPRFNYLYSDGKRGGYSYSPFVPATGACSSLPEAMGILGIEWRRPASTEEPDTKNAGEYRLRIRPKKIDGAYPRHAFYNDRDPDNPEFFVVFAPEGRPSDEYAHKLRIERRALKISLKDSVGVRFASKGRIEVPYASDRTKIRKLENLFYEHEPEPAGEPEFRRPFKTSALGGKIGKGIVGFKPNGEDETWNGYNAGSAPPGGTLYARSEATGAYVKIDGDAKFDEDWRTDYYVDGCGCESIVKGAIESCDEWAEANGIPSDWRDEMRLFEFEGSHFRGGKIGDCDRFVFVVWPEYEIRENYEVVLGEYKYYYEKNSDGTYSRAESFEPDTTYWLFEGHERQKPRLEARPSDWTAEPDPTDDSPSDKYYAVAADGQSFELAAKFDKRVDYYLPKWRKRETGGAEPADWNKFMPYGQGTFDGYPEGGGAWSDGLWIDDGDMREYVVFGDFAVAPPVYELNFGDIRDSLPYGAVASSAEIDFFRDRTGAALGTSPVDFARQPRRDAPDIPFMFDRREISPGAGYKGLGVLRAANVDTSEPDWRIFVMTDESKAQAIHDGGAPGGGGMKNDVFVVVMLAAEESGATGYEDEDGVAYALKPAADIPKSGKYFLAFKTIAMPAAPGSALEVRHKRGVTEVRTETATPLKVALPKPKEFFVAKLGVKIVLGECLTTKTYDGSTIVYKNGAGTASASATLELCENYEFSETLKLDDRGQRAYANMLERERGKGKFEVGVTIGYESEGAGENIPIKFGLVFTKGKDEFSKNFERRGPFESISGEIKPRPLRVRALKNPVSAESYALPYGTYAEVALRVATHDERGLEEKYKNGYDPNSGEFGAPRALPEGKERYADMYMYSSRTPGDLDYLKTRFYFFGDLPGLVDENGEIDSESRKLLFLDLDETKIDRWGAGAAPAWASGGVGIAHSGLAVRDAVGWDRTATSDVRPFVEGFLPHWLVDWERATNAETGVQAPFDNNSNAGKYRLALKARFERGNYAFMPEDFDAAAHGEECVDPTRIEIEIERIRPSLGRNAFRAADEATGRIMRYDGKPHFDDVVMFEETELGWRSSAMSFVDFSGHPDYANLCENFRNRIEWRATRYVDCRKPEDGGIGEIELGAGEGGEYQVYRDMVHSGKYALTVSVPETENYLGFEVEGLEIDVRPKPVAIYTTAAMRTYASGEYDPDFELTVAKGITRIPDGKAKRYVAYVDGDSMDAYPENDQGKFEKIYAWFANGDPESGAYDFSRVRVYLEGMVEGETFGEGDTEPEYVVDARKMRAERNGKYFDEAGVKAGAVIRKTRARKRNYAFSETISPLYVKKQRLEIRADGNQRATYDGGAKIPRHSAYSTIGPREEDRSAMTKADAFAAAYFAKTEDGEFEIFVWNKVDAYSAASGTPKTGKKYSKMSFARAIGSGDENGTYVDDEATPLPDFPFGYFERDASGTRYSGAREADPTPGAEYWRIAECAETPEYKYGDALEGFPDGYFLKDERPGQTFRKAKIASGPDSLNDYLYRFERFRSADGSPMRVVRRAGGYAYAVVDGVERALRNRGATFCYHLFEECSFESLPDDWNPSNDGAKPSTRYCVPTADGGYEFADEFSAGATYCAYSEVPAFREWVNIYRDADGFYLNEYAPSGPFDARPVDWASDPNASDDSPSDKYYRKGFDGEYRLARAFVPGATLYVATRTAVADVKPNFELSEDNADGRVGSIEVGGERVDIFAFIVENEISARRGAGGPIDVFYDDMFDDAFDPSRPGDEGGYIVKFRVVPDADKGGSTKNFFDSESVFAILKIERLRIALGSRESEGLPGLSPLWRDSYRSDDMDCMNEFSEYYPGTMNEWGEATREEAKYRPLPDFGAQNFDSTICEYFKKETGLIPLEPGETTGFRKLGQDEPIGKAGLYVILARAALKTENCGNMLFENTATQAVFDGVARAGEGDWDAYFVFYLIVDRSADIDGEIIKGPGIDYDGDASGDAYAKPYDSKDAEFDFSISALGKATNAAETINFRSFICDEPDASSPNRRPYKRSLRLESGEGAVAREWEDNRFASVRHAGTFYIVVVLNYDDRDPVRRQGGEPPTHNDNFVTKTLPIRRVTITPKNLSVRFPAGFALGKDYGEANSVAERAIRARGFEFEYEGYVDGDAARYPVVESPIFDWRLLGPDDDPEGMNAPAGPYQIGTKGGSVGAHSVEYAEGAETYAVEYRDYAIYNAGTGEFAVNRLELKVRAEGFPRAELTREYEYSGKTLAPKMTRYGRALSDEEGIPILDESGNRAYERIDDEIPRPTFRYLGFIGEAEPDKPASEYGDGEIDKTANPIDAGHYLYEIEMKDLRNYAIDEDCRKFRAILRIRKVALRARFKPIDGAAETVEREYGAFELGGQGSPEFCLEYEREDLRGENDRRAAFTGKKVALRTRVALERGTHAFSRAKGAPKQGDIYWTFADGEYAPALPGDGKYVDDASTPLANFPNGYFKRSIRQPDASIPLRLYNPLYVFVDESGAELGETPRQVGTYRVRLWQNEHYGVARNYEIALEDSDPRPSLRITERKVSVLPGNKPVAKTYDATDAVPSGAVSAERDNFKFDRLVEGDDIGIAIRYDLSKFERIARLGPNGEEAVRAYIAILGLEEGGDNANYALDWSNEAALPDDLDRRVPVSRLDPTPGLAIEGGALMRAPDALRALTIPEGVDSIAPDAFVGCPGLKCVFCPSATTEELEAMLEGATLPAGSIALGRDKSAKIDDLAPLFGVRYAMLNGRIDRAHARVVFRDCDGNALSGAFETIYDGRQQSPVIEVKGVAGEALRQFDVVEAAGDYDARYESSALNYDELNAPPTACGTYAVTVRVDRNPNYGDEGSKLTLRILKAEVEISFSGDDDQEYGSVVGLGASAAPKSVLGDASAFECELRYWSIDAAGEARPVDDIAVAPAGEYRVEAISKADDNYESATKFGRLRIRPKSVAANSDLADSYPYSGRPISVAIYYQVGALRIAPTLMFDKLVDGKWSPVDGYPVDAGEYRAKPADASFGAASSNYRPKNPEWKEFRIAKAPLTLRAKDLELTENPDGALEISPSVEAVGCLTGEAARDIVSGLRFEYYASDGARLDGPPTAPGTYSVLCAADGSENYSPLSFEFGRLIINRKRIAVAPGPDDPGVEGVVFDRAFSDKLEISLSKSSAPAESRLEKAFRSHVALREPDESSLDADLAHARLGDVYEFAYANYVPTGNAEDADCEISIALKEVPESARDADGNVRIAFLTSDGSVEIRLCPLDADEKTVRLSVPLTSEKRIDAFSVVLSEPDKKRESVWLYVGIAALGALAIALAVILVLKKA